MRAIIFHSRDAGDHLSRDASNHDSVDASDHDSVDASDHDSVDASDHDSVDASDRDSFAHSCRNGRRRLLFSARGPQTIAIRRGLAVVSRGTPFVFQY